MAVSRRYRSSLPPSMLRPPPKGHPSHPTEAQLAWYVDRVLRGGDADRDGVAEHVKVCHLCAKEVDVITAQWDEGDD